MDSTIGGQTEMAIALDGALTRLHPRLDLLSYGSMSKSVGLVSALA